MFIACPNLRKEYLQIRKEPINVTTSRKTALKLSQLLKLKEIIPFDTLCNCIIYGDNETHGHLIRHAGAYDTLVHGVNIYGCKEKSLLCLRILGYSVDWLCSDD
jgi:hypothetical protein